MAYRAAIEVDIAFFAEHGWLLVEDAIDPSDLVALERRCDEIIANKETMAYDWAWDDTRAKDDREFKILQGSPSRHTGEFTDAPFRTWAVEFGSALLGAPVEFWYDQFLAKPPHKSAATLWHQDEGYWGRALDDKGITCWMPFHDVDVRNGCMHFIDGGHRDGVLTHERPPHVQSDLLTCRPDESRTVACPIELGSVTFDHGKTPHMTTANTTDAWRRILTQHLKAIGVAGEGDHHPWKVYVNQFTGELITPDAVTTGPPAAARAATDLDRAISRSAGISAALAVLLATSGRVVVTGLGKSGLIGGKLAATFASTGTPSFFVHSADALHGDAGMACPGDVLLALSKSGETDEVLTFATMVRSRGIPVIALTSCGGDSTLCTLADAVLDAGIDREGDPWDLVPTASTTVSLVVGDALAIGLMVARDFGPEQFRTHHPGGAVGRRLDGRGGPGR